jgi:hypothetical protein
MVDEYFMTTAEKAEELGLSESRTRKLCSSGKIPDAVKRYNVWHIPIRRSEPIVADSEAWPWESAKEAAVRLGITLCHCRDLCRMGILETWKVPGFRAWHVKKGAMPSRPIRRSQCKVKTVLTTVQD